MPLDFLNRLVDGISLPTLSNLRRLFAAAGLGIAASRAFTGSSLPYSSWMQRRCHVSEPSYSTCR